MDPSTLTLFIANREQTIESRKRTHVQWGKDWSIERYLARDARLDEFEQASGGKLRTWCGHPINTWHNTNRIIIVGF
jgi:hypothetical protein